jgi:hypothetical protein
VESHAPARTIEWRPPFAAKELPRIRTEPAGEGLVGWRQRWPLAAAIAAGVLATIGCMLAVTWLAVVIAADGPGAGAALPWAIGCAAAALLAFGAALAALLLPRRRKLLATVAAGFLVLMATGALGAMMSGASADVEGPGGGATGLLSRSSG